MKILLSVPFDMKTPCGNSIAARRLAAGFRRHGHEAELIYTPDGVIEHCLKALVQDFSPDVALVLHAWRSAAVFHALCREHSFPVVVSIRGSDMNEMMPDPQAGQEVAAVLDRADAIVVFNQQTRQKLADRNRQWSDKTEVIPNGVSLGVSDVDYRIKLGIPSSALVFVSVAGIREIKRPLLAVPWLAALRSAFPHIGWMHTGPLMEMEFALNLQVLLDRHAWTRHIDITPHEEMDSFLRAADVFVSASRSEGMPHACREAMLAGLPLLLSDIEGHRLLADPEKEALFFVDGESFVRQAERLIAEPELRRRLGENGRKRVICELQDHDEIAGYVKVFTRLLSQI